MSTPKKNKKIIKLYIDEEEFPFLFNIKNDDIADICYNIFKNGYTSMFPNLEKNSEKNKMEKSIIKTIDNHTDTLKYNLQEVKNSLNNLDLEERFNQLNQIMEELFGINNNSSKKGKLSENLIYSILKSKFKNYTIEETRNKPHHADGLIHIPKENSSVKVMLEIKNYTRAVDKDEIDKLYYDMKYTGIKYSIFVSIKSGFVGRKQMSIEEFYYNNEKYTIIFIPNATDEINKIEAGLLLIERLIEYNFRIHDKKTDLKWLEKNISNHLRELDDIYSNFTILKQKFYKTETNIKQNLSSFYENLRSYEIDVKEKTNKIWGLIQNDIYMAEKELIVSDNMDKIINNLKANLKYKYIIKLFELLKKKGYNVETTIDKETNKIWNLIGPNNEQIGTIVYSKNKISVMIENPKITVDLNNNNINNDLLIMDTILK